MLYLSLSMCKCLEFSLLFPHFFTGLLIITTANGTTIIIKGNRNIDTKLGKDSTEGIFFFIKQMGARARVFVLQKTTKTKCNAIHEETQKKQKKSYSWFFDFYGLFSKLGFGEIHELMSFISCSNCSCWRWRCCYCSRIIVAVFSGGGGGGGREQN